MLRRFAGGVPQIVSKPSSTKKKLIIPTTVAFLTLIITMILSAYFLFSSNVTSSTNEQTLSASQQVLTNYESYFDSVISASNNILGKYANVDEASIETDMQSYFTTIESFKSEILRISLYKASDGSYLSGDNSTPKGGANTTATWFTSATDNPLINIFSPVSSNYPNVQYIFTLSKYVFFDKNRSLDAVLRIDYDFAKIVDTISPATLGTGGRFIIYTKDYQTIYTSSETGVFSDQEKGLVENLVIGSTTVTFDNHYFYLYAATITNTSWRVAIFTNQDALRTAITRFTWIIGLVGLALIIAFVVVLNIVANSITKPIKQLQKEMADIESLNYQTNLQPEIKGSAEVVELNHSFNQMMGRITELTSAIVSEKEEQRKSELKALQNQINPHFLYNTLDSIIAMIDKGENSKAEDMIVALSKFFRISISKGQNIIPLPNEIEHARNYLLIQKMRFGDSFSYTIDVEPGLEKYFVVKLILQPLVENSIGHGMKEGEVGRISIRAFSDGDFIKFEIKDNGYGMTPEKVDELVKSLDDDTVYQGVGLKNVYQRIRIYYGEKANLLIQSEEDVGTTITIVIPKEGANFHEE
jgi:two-component system sensor histidine kinase YesM